MRAPSPWLDVLLILSIAPAQQFSPETAGRACHAPLDKVLIDALLGFGFEPLPCAWIKLNDYDISYIASDGFGPASRLLTGCRVPVVDGCVVHHSKNRPTMAEMGQNEPCHPLRRHGRSTSISGLSLCAALRFG